MAVFGDDHVVLDADSSERRKLGDELPVEPRGRLSLAKHPEKHLDEVKAGLHRENVTRLDGAGVSEIRVFWRRGCLVPLRIPEMASYIVDLKAEVMAETVRKKRPGPAPSFRLFGIGAEQIALLQKASDLEVGRPVQVAEGEAGTDLPAELLLKLFDAVAQRGESRLETWVRVMSEA